MNLVRTQAFLLRKRDYSDTSLIVVFFTADFGKVQFIVKGAKAKKGSFFGSFEHFSCYEILFQRRPGHRGLIILREARLIEGFPEIRQSLDCLYHASYCIELLDAFTELEDSDSTLFKLVFEALVNISHEKDLDLKVRAFEIALLKHLGFLGDFSICISCRRPFQEKAYLDQKSLRLCCMGCSKKEAVPFDWKYLKWTSALESHTSSQIPPEARDQIQKLLWFYIDFHLGKPLKSRKFLCQQW